MMKNILIILLLTSSVLFSEEIETNSIKDTFAQEIKTEFNDDFDIWGVEFYKNRSMMRFSKSDLMYLPGSSEMQISFEVILKDFYPRYLEFLLDFKDSIKEVVIIGHTSSENSKAKTVEGKYLRNLVLSQDRAAVVLKYIKSLNDDIVVNNIDWINETFRSVGLSSSKPILDKNGKEDRFLSRRIEIQVIFKNDDKNIENSDQDQIKKVKKSKLLSSYIQQLLIENPTINEQYQILSSMKQDIKIAQAAFKPTVTLNYSKTKYNQSNPADQTDAQAEDITLKYNLFNGFKDENEQSISEENYKASKTTKDQIVSGLVYTLAEAFIEIQRQKEILEISKKNLEDYDKWIEKEKIRFQNGLISLKDYAKINSRDTTQRMNYQEMMRTYKDSIATFEKYIDFDKKDIEIFEELNISSVYFQNRKLSLDDAKVFSPYINEAEQNIALYKAKIEKAKVNFYPTVDLTTKVSQSENTYKSSSDKTEERTIMLEAKLELYSGGKDEANYEKKLFEYRQKVQKKDEVIRDVLYKVNLAHNKYELVVIKNQFLTRLISQREESYIGANYDYKFAKIDANGLLDVVDDLYNAKKQFIENKYDMILAKYKILSDIGIIRETILDE